MFYVMGDIHGYIEYVQEFYHKYKPGKDDTLIILGDAGLNFFLDNRDKYNKNTLSYLPFSIFCIHGNHEERPENIKTYKMKKWNGGIVYYEEAYPNILFAKDGEVYDLKGNKTLVLGGAYSIDREYRIKNGNPYFKSELMPHKVKKAVLEKIKKDNNYDIILSHTCPYKYKPVEAFLPGIDQSRVDNSMEEFLEIVENNINYKKWYCGHFHINKKIDKIIFLYHDVDIL